MEKIKIFLLLLTAFFYLLIIALWIILTEQIMLNFVVSIITLLLTMVLLFLERKRVKVFAESKLFTYLLNSGIRTFLLICCLGLVNFLFFKHPVVKDFSKNGMSSLSLQTNRVLQKLNGPLIAKVFARKVNQPHILAVLELYRYAKGNLVIELYDSDLEPLLVKQYQIERDGVVVFEYGGKKEKVFAESELALTNALIRLGREKEIKLCWSKGHGEIALNDSSDKGASFLKDILRKSSYGVHEISIKERGIKKSCDVLVLLAPQSGFLKQEIKSIQQFLAHQGKMILGMGPNFEADAFKNMREMLIDYGLVINNDFVVDRISYVNGSNGLIPLIKNLSKESIITKNIGGQVFFPLVSSISYVENKIKGKMNVLASSSNFPASWAETSLQEMLTKKISFHDGEDRKGPSSVAVSWSALDSSKDHTQLVLIGNGTFLQNKYKRFSDNFAFFINSVAWLSGEDQLQSFTDIILEKKSILISTPLRQTIFYFSLFFSPLIFLFISLFVYYRRRNL